MAITDEELTGVYVDPATQVVVLIYNEGDTILRIEPGYQDGTLLDEFQGEGFRRVYTTTNEV